MIGLAALLVALLALSVVVITHWNWNNSRPWISQKVSDATGREFHVRGDLTAEWHWPQPLESGWRRWIPGVTVLARDVSIGNPEGFLIAEESTKAPKTPTVTAGAQAAKPVAAHAMPALPAKMTATRIDRSLRLAPARQRSAASAPATPASAATPPGSDAQSNSSDQDTHSDRTDAEDARRLLARESGEARLEATPRDDATMATIARVSATVRLLPLLSRTVVLDTVVLSAPDVALGRAKDGSNNWTFKEPANQQPTAWNLSLGQLIVRDGWLGYVDGVKDLALRAHIDTLHPDENDGEANADGPYGLHMTMHGRYGKAQISGEGLAGPILSLRKKVDDYPIHLKARAGSLRAEAKGILTNPRSLAGMDLQVSLQGASMADLYQLTGLVLPSTPAFKTSGRLLGSLAPDEAVWEYRDFDGTVGSSDLHGSLTYTSAKPRPRLEGRMLSKRLRLVDLAPLIGKNTAQDASLQRKGRVLPDAPFETGRWSAMDLDIAFTGESIIRPASLPIENLSTRAVLQDGKLSLSPLRFGVARGKINANLALDSNAQPLKVQLDGTADGVQLGALFPKVELMRKSFGRLDGGFSIATRGNSVASMLGHSNGELKLFIRDGTFSKEMLDLAALNIGSVVVTKLFGANREIQLRCAVADLPIRDGIATTRVAKLSTEEAMVETTGAINLRDERLDLRIKPESLKWKFFSLRTPLYVKGSFADPQVGVESGPLLLRAGAAVVAAVVAPVALAIVPITVPAAEDDANCKAMLAQVQAH